MDSLERLMRAAPLPTSVVLASSAAAAAAAAGGQGGGGGVGIGGGGGGGGRRALVHASLASASAVGRKGRHLTGTFCLTGDTMEGIIQCLVFLKAFSVSRTRGDVVLFAPPSLGRVLLIPLLQRQGGTLGIGQYARRTWWRWRAVGSSAEIWLFTDVPGDPDGRGYIANGGHCSRNIEVDAEASDVERSRGRLQDNKRVPRPWQTVVHVPIKWHLLGIGWGGNKMAF